MACVARCGEEVLNGRTGRRTGNVCGFLLTSVVCGVVPVHGLLLIKELGEGAK
jgi:hypothetical protein